MPFLQGALWEMKSVMEAVGLVLVVCGDDTCYALTGQKHKPAARLTTEPTLINPPSNQPLDVVGQPIWTVSAVRLPITERISDHHSTKLQNGEGLSSQSQAVGWVM